MQQSTWQPRLDEILIIGHANRISFSLISKQIEKETGVIVSRDAVIGRAFRLRLPPRGHQFQHSEMMVPKRRGVSHPRKRPRSPEYSSSTMRLISFAELQPNDCRFPDGHHPFIRYCGRPKAVGSYCFECDQRAHRLERWGCS